MENADPFRFRRALPMDKAAVEALCARIWDGDDYVPRCFDAWAADEAGELALCFAGDRLAGIAKLTWLAPGEAWLEGLRKDPDLPVKGVGTALCRHMLARLARTEGLRTIRFSTYFQNHASIKLNEALGFRRIATASVKSLEREPLRRFRESGHATDPRVCEVREADPALAFVRASSWFGPFIHQAWRSYPWTEDLFVRRYVEPGNVLGLVEAGRLKALAAVLVEPDKGDGALPFFDAEDEASARPLLDEAARRLGAQGAPWASAIVPPGGARACRLLDACGWHSEEREEDYLVYEFPLDRLREYRAPLQASSSSHAL